MHRLSLVFSLSSSNSNIDEKIDDDDRARYDANFSSQNNEIRRKTDKEMHHCHREIANDSNNNTKIMTGKRNKNDEQSFPHNEVQCDSNDRRIVITEKTNFTQAEDGLMAETYEEYKKEDDDRVISGDDDVLKQDSRLIKDILMEKTKDPKVSV